MTFRTWCQEKWYEHLAELEGYGQQISYPATDYFTKYKWWLKREYQFQNFKKP